MSSFKSIGLTDLNRILSTTRSLNNLSISDYRWPDDLPNNGQLTLTGCELIDVTFSGADLEGLNADNCEFSRCNFRSANLREARFTDGRFYSQEEEVCAFCLADLVAAQFKDCNLTLCDADLRNAMIAGIDLRKIDLTGVKIMEWQQRFLLECIGMTIFSD